MNYRALTDFCSFRKRIRARLGAIALATLIVSIGLTSFPNTAAAWGRFGHRAAAKLTLTRLNPAARKAVVELLEPGETLADASTWADDQRRTMPETGPWHYVNVPITEAAYSNKFCPDTGCVVTKVDDFRKLLSDNKLPRGERQQALRFLVHFVQDMHQPLHVGDRSDRGGNDCQVQFFGQGSNMHRVWDSGLIEKQFKDESALLDAITKKAADPATATWNEGTIEDWANESFNAAKRAFTNPVDKKPMKKGAKLGDAYQDANLDTAVIRVSQAGVRLAEILNEIFPEPK